MLQRHAQLRQWPLEVLATRQGCSKDRQETQTPPLLCVTHHGCKKKKTHKRHRKLLYKDKLPCGVLRRRRRATSVFVAQRVVQQQAVIFRGPSTRHVSALSRNTNANRAEKQVADNEMCHAPANFPFSAGLFLCRVLSLYVTALFLCPPHHSVSGDKDDCTSKKNRVRSTRSLRVALPAHCGKHAQEQHFTMLHPRVEQREAVESRDSVSEGCGDCGRRRHEG